MISVSLLFFMKKKQQQKLYWIRKIILCFTNSLCVYYSNLNLFSSSLLLLVSISSGLYDQTCFCLFFPIRSYSFSISKHHRKTIQFAKNCIERDIEGRSKDFSDPRNIMLSRFPRSNSKTN